MASDLCFVPLESRPSRAAVRRYAAGTRVKGLSTTAGSLRPAVIVAGASLALGPLVGWLGGALGVTLPGPWTAGFSFTVGGCVVAAVLFIVAAVSVPIRRASAWRRRCRLAAFAAANDLDYAPEVTWLGDAYPGKLFIGHDRVALYDRFRSHSSAALEVGNLRWANHHLKGGDSFSRRWGYVMIGLDGQAGSPRTDLRGTDGASDLAVDIRIALEERAVSYEVEAVEDRVCLYSRHPFDLCDPIVWKGLMGVVDIVAEQAFARGFGGGAVAWRR